MQLQDLRQIQDRYHHIYIAPHFDDAALSCGGAIARYVAIGQEVLVITICAGYPSSANLTPFAGELHTQWGIEDDPVAARRQEELMAIGHLGADVFWLPELDAIYRHPAYDSREAIFSTPAADDPLRPILHRRLAQITERASSAIYYFPLAVGNHVDHQIAYAVGCELADSGVTVAFYEDLPYAIAPNAVQERLDQIGIPLLPDVVDISQTLPRKLGAVAEYRSQIPVLFESEEDMINALTRYATLVATEGTTYGERLWLRAVAQ